MSQAASVRWVPEACGQQERGQGRAGPSHMVVVVLLCWAAQAPREGLGLSAHSRRAFTGDVPSPLPSGWHLSKGMRLPRGFTAKQTFFL